MSLLGLHSQGVVYLEVNWILYSDLDREFRGSALKNETERERERERDRQRERERERERDRVREGE